MQLQLHSFIISLASLAVITISITMPAQAASLTWSVQNAVFEDGSTLTGTFDYDADTNTYSNVNIAVSSGILNNFVYQGSTCSQTPGVEHTCIADKSQSPDQFLIGVFNHNYYPVDSGMKGYLFLAFMEKLTNAGGTVPITNAGELWFAPEGGDTHRSGLRTVARGQVSSQAPGAAVPEPTTMAGFGLASAGLAYLRRRRQRV